MKVGQITRDFVRADFSIFADLRQKCQCIMSLIVAQSPLNNILDNAKEGSTIKYHNFYTQKKARIFNFQ